MRRLMPVAAAILLAFPLGLAGGPAHAAAAPRYTIRFLSPLAGDEEAGATALDSRGDVVGASSLGGSSRAVVWKIGSSRPINLDAGLGGSAATGVSSAGIVAVTKLSAPRQGILWRPSGSTIVATPAVYTSVTLGGLSELGHAPARATTTTGVVDAFAVAPDGTATRLDRATSGATATDVRPDGISADGKRFAGSIRTSASGFNWLAVRWASPPAMTLLDQLPATTSAGALDVNAQGSAVGWTYSSALTRNVPTLWAANTPVAALPTPGGMGAQATALNDSGVVVGSGANTALIWVDGQPSRLQDLLTEPTAMTLISATDVNNAGQVVGQARGSDGRHLGYIATPVTQLGFPIVHTMTPGYFELNGRRWQTTCSPYSATVNRCRTEIWATTISLVNGKYVQSTGWLFNNLTYLPAPKSAWGTNPLANPGSWTVNGRQWKTECNTPQTGSNNCRSYIWATVYKSEKLANGTWRYWAENVWAFNNIVMIGVW